MNPISVALAPILALILLGYGLKRFKFIPDAAWVGSEKLTYFVLFPALLVSTLAKPAVGAAPWRSMLLIIVIVLLLSAGVLLLWHRWRASVDGPTFTSIFQGGVRFNTYIALALAQSFYGLEGLAMGAVAAGFMIVLINLLCIGAFAVWGVTAQRRTRPWVHEVLGNPLIVSCLVGWTLRLSGIELPVILDDTLAILGRAALPLGLLAVGASLRPAALRGHAGAISIATLVQFGLKPISVFWLLQVLGLNGIAAGAIFLAFMVPTASSAAILSRQLGGDTEAMASIITFQTLIGFVAMPLLALLRPV